MTPNSKEVINPIQSIIGLGNPGKIYRDTRHNIGQKIILSLSRTYNVELLQARRFSGLFCQIILNHQKIHLLAPTNYMNLSGLSVKSLVNFYRIPTSSILIIHDDLDLPPGIARFKQGGGHGGHNGLRNIIGNLNGSCDFFRLRLGIGRPKDSSKVSSYVLERASKKEDHDINQAIKMALSCLPNAVCGNWQHAMQSLHNYNKKTK
jgi:PTH1 family peptidyl-tRNA hydrolase